MRILQWALTQSRKRNRQWCATELVKFLHALQTQDKDVRCLEVKYAIFRDCELETGHEHAADVRVLQWVQEWTAHTTTCAAGRIDSRAVAG